MRGISVEVDGVRVDDPSAGIPLRDDGAVHHVRALLGGRAQDRSLAG
jgi:hypothetical protein